MTDQELQGIIDNIIDTFSGLLLGVLRVQFSHIEKCITYGESTYDDFMHAYEQLSSRSVSSVKEGIMMIGRVLYDLLMTCYNCASIPGDFRKIAELAAAFSNPVTLVIKIGIDLVFHGKSIYKEIKAAIAAFEADPRNYFGFGYNIGSAAAHIFIGEQGEALRKEIQKQEVANIQKGLLKSYGGDFTVEDLYACIEGEDKAIKIIDSAIMQLNDARKFNKPEDLIGGMIVMAGLAQFYKMGLDKCNSVDTASFNFKQFSNTLDIAARPSAHFQVIDNQVQVNGVSIQADANEALIAYIYGQHEVFGEKMGNLFRIATDVEFEEAFLAQPVETPLTRLDSVNYDYKNNLYLY